MFAHIESGGLVKFMRELPFTWKGVTPFPALPALQRALLGVVPVIDVTPPYDPALYRIAAVRPAVAIFADRVEVVRTVELIPLPPPPTAQEQAELDRRAAINAEAQADILIEKMRTATPLEIKNYVQNNITNLDTAKAVISRLAVAVSYALIH
jgi:hypothetical protein